VASKVTVMSVAISAHEHYGWRGIVSPKVPKSNEKLVKIQFSVSQVTGGTETVDRALSRLKHAKQFIVNYHTGLLRATPTIICKPGYDTVADMWMEETVDNSFALGLAEDFRKLLDKFGSRAKSN